MAWYPGALRKECAKHNRRVAPARNRINLHVAVSEAKSLYGYFSGAAVCSHFYIRKDGTVEQYIDTRYFSAADMQGNDATVSIETQGGVHDAQGEPWTPPQVAALAALILWLTQVHPSIPMKLATDSVPGPSSKGVSYHRLGIDPWRHSAGLKYSNARGKICPGNAKISQITHIAALAATGGVVLVDNKITPEGNGGTVKNWLAKGDSGEDVRELQRLLTSAGFGTEIDGHFGPLTETRVREYQNSRGLVIDGLAGQATLTALTEGRPAKIVPIEPKMLSEGSTGPTVTALQSTLNHKFPSFSRLIPDGIFGPATKAVVIEFQRRNGLEVDGIVGPLTQKALDSASVEALPPPAPVKTVTLSRGSKGEDVKRLQSILNRRYPSYSRLVVDGDFGPATEKVVREFQRRSGLEFDGIVGPITSRALGLTF